MTLPVDNLTKPADLADTANGQLADPPLAGFALPERPSALLHHLAARAFRAFFAEVRSRFGVELSASSTVDCYRNYTVQRSTFLARYTTTPLEGRPTKRWNGVTYWQRPGTAIAATPGTSNHGWGLAVDVAVAVPLNGGGHTIVGITSRRDVLQWMLDNAHRYGLSWEAQSEPWHIRYNTGDRIPQAVLDYEAGGTYIVDAIRSNVQVGSKGKMVRRAQYACQLITGAPATVDGDFGGQTDEAIRNFQRFFGLKDDGQVGPKTWAVLEQITND
jgi:LAS superfamily LD-carboxypeptidase LdcB